MILVHAVAGLFGLAIAVFVCSAFVVVFAIASDNWLITGILASAFIVDRVLKYRRRS